MIHEGCAGTESGIGKSHLLCDVFEGAVASIPIEAVSANSRYEQVEMTVVVEIAHRDSHAIDGRVETGGVGNILEVPSVQVPIKHPGSCVGPVPGKRGAIGEVEIRSAISVVIEEGCAGTHRLRKVATRGGIIEMDKVNSCLFRDIRAEILVHF